MTRWASSEIPVQVEPPWSPVTRTRYPSAPGTSVQLSARSPALTTSPSAGRRNCVLLTPRTTRADPTGRGGSTKRKTRLAAMAVAAAQPIQSCRRTGLATADVSTWRDPSRIPIPSLRWRSRDRRQKAQTSLCASSNSRSSASSAGDSRFRMRFPTPMSTHSNPDFSWSSISGLLVQARGGSGARLPASERLTTEQASIQEHLCFFYANVSSVVHGLDGAETEIVS